MTTLSIFIPAAPKPTVNTAGNTVAVSDVDFYLLKWEHSKAQDRQNKYEEGMKTAYTIMFHQCSPALKTELEGTTKFITICSTQDVIGLLGHIKGFCCSFDVKTQGMMATVEVHKHLYMFYQCDNVDNQSYHREFIAHVEMIDTYGGTNTLGVVPTLVMAELKRMESDGLISNAAAPSGTERKLAEDTIRDEYLAALLIFQTFSPWVRIGIQRLWLLALECWTDTM